MTSNYIKCPKTTRKLQKNNFKKHVWRLVALCEGSQRKCEAFRIKMFKNKTKKNIISKNILKFACWKKTIYYTRRKVTKGSAKHSASKCVKKTRTTMCKTNLDHNIFQIIKAEAQNLTYPPLQNMQNAKAKIQIDRTIIVK